MISLSEALDSRIIPHITHSQNIAAIYEGIANGEGVAIYEAMTREEQIEFMFDYFRKIKDDPDTIDDGLLNQFVDMTFSDEESLKGLFGFLKKRNFSENQIQSVINGMNAGGYRQDMVKFLAANNGSEADKLHFSTLCKPGKHNLVQVICQKYGISPEFVTSICQNTTGSSAAVGKGEMALAIFCCDAMFDNAEVSKGEDKADIRIVNSRGKGVEVKCGCWQPKGQKTDFKPSVDCVKEFLKGWCNNPNIKGGIRLYEIAGTKDSIIIASKICDNIEKLLPSEWLTNNKKTIDFLIRKQTYNSDIDINKALLAVTVLCYHASEKFGGIFMLASRDSKRSGRKAFDYIYIDDFSPKSIFDFIFSGKDACATNLDAGSDRTSTPKMQADNYFNI